MTNSVVLGEYVNINNKYTLPNVDGASGSYMVTDGFGNLNWTSSPAEYQNLEDVLTLGNWTGYNSIEMGTGSSLYSVRGGGQINLDYAPDTVVISTDNGNLNKAYIQLDDEDIILVSNLSLNIGVGSASISVSNGEGLQYAFDYSSTFVTYSLVDKNYVDLGTASIWSTINSINNDFVSEVVAGDGLSGGGTSGTVTLDLNVGNGLELVSDTLYLGGTLSQNTLINGNNFDFKVEGANQISLTASNSTEYDYVFLGNGTTLGTTDGLNFSQLNSSIINISLLYQNSTGNNSSFEANPNGSFMYINNGLSQSVIQIYNSNQTIGLGDGSSNNTMIIEDEFSSKGLVYYDDYSANFTTYSLVTKGYVDSQVGTSTSKYATIVSFTASVTQTITHSLGTDYIIVQTYNSSGQMVIGDVGIVDGNSVDIRFSETLSNIKIVIIG